MTYTGSSPQALFASQTIAGFYRDPSWTTCLGVPIYDYGASNGSFTTTEVAMTTPEIIYGPADEFLNGGPLQNVLQKLAQATYLESSDKLVELLDYAISVQGTWTASG